MDDRYIERAHQIAKAWAGTAPGSSPAAAARQLLGAAYLNLRAKLERVTAAKEFALAELYGERARAEAAEAREAELRKRLHRFADAVERNFSDHRTRTPDGAWWVGRIRAIAGRSRGE